MWQIKGKSLHATTKTASIKPRVKSESWSEINIRYNNNNNKHILNRCRIEFIKQAKKTKKKKKKKPKQKPEQKNKQTNHTHKKRITKQKKKKTTTTAKKVPNKYNAKIKQLLWSFLKY